MRYGVPRVLVQLYMGKDAMSKPNILFILTDQLRWDALGCTGGWVRTPALDRIAQAGVRFTQCVTNAPVCIPARVSLATGRYPHNTGVWDNCTYDLPEDTPTWMQAIRGAGYRTSLFGKTHLHRHQGDLRDRECLLHAVGLDDVDEIGGPRASTAVLSHVTERWQRKGWWDAYKADYERRYAIGRHTVGPSALPLEEYADVYVGQQARAYLTAYQRAEPWFCWVSFGGPHEPWDAPEPYASMYPPEAMPPPTPRPTEVLSRPRGVLDVRCENNAPISLEDAALMRANYAGNVTLIDDQIAGLLETIEARGEMDRTMIVFCSDHGELNGDYGLDYKSCFLDGAVRVPLIVRTPETARRKDRGRVSDALVEWIDLGPTMVEWAGGQMNHTQFAKSLGPVLAHPKTAHRPFVISEFDGEILYMDHEWKLALNAEGLPYLLFNRQNDPDEQINRVTDATTLPLQTALLQRIREHGVATQVEERMGF